VSPAPYPPVDGRQPCAKDPEKWFPPSGENAAEAKKACKPCPFRESCLAYAIDYKVDGVWGGTSRAQRDIWRRVHGITGLSVNDAFGPHLRRKAAS
jgi:hypothetical protein